MRAPEDLAAFCERQWPRLVGSMSLYCGDRGVAEELAQDALEKVCLHWDEVRMMAAPGAWVHRVAVNLANSRFRRLRAGRRAVDRLRSLRHDPQQDDDLRAGDDAALRRAIDRLPARQRQALVLRYYSDLSPEQVADVMGCTAQAVRNLTHRAIEKLRDHLDEQRTETGVVLSDVE